MDSVLRESLPFPFVYMSHLRILLERLNQRGLVVNPAECQLGRPSVHFLGHDITWDGAAPLPSKVAAVADFSQPPRPPALQES